MDDGEVYDRKALVVFGNEPYLLSAKDAIDDIGKVRVDRNWIDREYPKVYGISLEGVPYLMSPIFETGEYDKTGFRHDRVILKFKDGASVYTYINIDGNG